MGRNTVIILLRFGHISALPIAPPWLPGPAQQAGVMLVVVPVAALRLPFSLYPFLLLSPLRGSRPGHFQACLQNASVARHITEAGTGAASAPLGRLPAVAVGWAKSEGAMSRPRSSCVRTPSQARGCSSAFAAGQVKRQVKPEGA
jgi:hypothetical protein